MKVVFIALALLLLPCIRVRHTKLGYGSYWSIDLVNPLAH